MELWLGHRPAVVTVVSSILLQRDYVTFGYLLFEVLMWWHLCELYLISVIWRVFLLNAFYHLTEGFVLIYKKYSGGLEIWIYALMGRWVEWGVWGGHKCLSWLHQLLLFFGVLFHFCAIKWSNGLKYLPEKLWHRSALSSAVWDVVVIKQDKY